MKNKPWPLIIFAGIQILVPVFSLLLNSLFLGVSPIAYMNAFLRVSTTPEIIEFVALFPLAGLAILTMKKWAYPVFLMVAGWTVFANTYIWFVDYSQESMAMAPLLAANLFNLVCIGYYLHPSVRRVFMDSTVRWWESAPRYITHTAGVFAENGQKEDCEIVNVSRGGALIKTNKPIDFGQKLQLQFALKNFEVDTPVEVVYSKAGHVGVKFHNKPTYGTQVETELKTMDLDLQRTADPVAESFRLWVEDLKKGQGIIPTV